jgi:hypothetical protein
VSFRDLIALLAANGWCCLVFTRGIFVVAVLLSFWNGFAGRCSAVVTVDCNVTVCVRRECTDEFAGGVVVSIVFGVACFKDVVEVNVGVWFAVVNVTVVFGPEVTAV